MIKINIPKVRRTICKRTLPCITLIGWGSKPQLPACCKPPRYVPYKGTYVPYDGTYGASDQGQMLDVREGQTAKSALRDDWTQNVSHHTLEVVLEVILEHMCTGLKP